MLGKWSSIDSSLYENSVVGTSKELLDVNKEQLLDSDGVDGNPLPRYKWDSYRDWKRNNGARFPDNYNMYHTGHSFQTMSLQVSNGKYEIKSLGTAQTWDNKLKGNIFGITQGTTYLLDYRQNFLYPEIVKNIKTLLNG